MMQVCLDGRCLNTGHLRGMGKYALNLIQSMLAREPDVSFHVLADEPRLPMHVPRDSRLSRRVWEVSGHRFRAWEQIGLPWESRGATVLHCLGTWAPVWQPVPVVVTLHDTLPWDSANGGSYVHRIAPRALAKAAWIITISESSRKDILARWPGLASRLSVIPHGISQQYFADRQATPEMIRNGQIKGKYLLYFGGEMRRKRLDWAVRVWQQLGREDVSLVVCGLTELGRQEWTSRIPPPERSRFICLPFVPEDQLPGLYSRAEAVLYPTLYEGFGFPAVEAQAVGVPILMSAVGSLVELCGPGAVVLPPEDLDAWTGALRGVLDGDRPSVEAARRWARQFTWEAAADRTYEVYRRVSGNPPRMH